MRKLERDSRGALASTPQNESAMVGGRQGRYRIAVVARRSRLIDPDNIAIKDLVDALRYAGVIPDDSAREIASIEIRQEKVRKGEEETVVEIETVT